MTRLQANDIYRITEQMKEYNEELANKTGHTIIDIAAHAVGMNPTDLFDDPGLIAILPMTC
ncbi:hypothetical protein [Desulfosporosinus orientis]|uniref:hypothetical protein n=1 Tax=Desulfosporosinus orientis TaxID=1563 RepID=UPI0002DEC794|nr:hypothetical protein [Desulfosporosinus orientis]